MKRSSYGERDYAFGQTMLTLRTAIGLTQTGLAELLGVSRKAISKWEAGDSYPKAQYISNRKKGGEKSQREILSDRLSTNLKRESRKDPEAMYRVRYLEQNDKMRKPGALVDV